MPEKMGMYPLDEKELIEAEMNSSPEKLKEIDNMANTLMALLKSNPGLLKVTKGYFFIPLSNASMATLIALKLLDARPISLVKAEAR